MHKDSKILVTGGAGFIGSNMVKFLNDKGFKNICIRDPNIHSQWKNLLGLEYWNYNDEQMFDGPNFNKTINKKFIFDVIIELGAHSHTTLEANEDNYNNNVLTFNYFGSPKVIYASSGATYGLEDEDFTERLDVKPINFYGFTKLKCDENWSKLSAERRSNIYGLRFFNVYGPNERYKGAQSSVISKWLTDPIVRKRWADDPLGPNIAQINLFKSDKDQYKDGMQCRDFIYVEDVCKVIFHFMNDKSSSGDIYNVGSGKSNTWLDVAKEVLLARKIATEHDYKKFIGFIDMPEKLVGQYQYRTKANIGKLYYVAGIGPDQMTSLSDGIRMTYEILKKNN